MGRVSAIRVSEHDDLAQGFAVALRQIEGLAPVSLPEQVLIKPNLCDITSWETGATTDPRWIGVLAREFRAIRPDVRIRVVESDAVSAYKHHRSCDETFERLGWVHAAREENVELVNLSRAETIELRLNGLPMAVRVPQMFLEEMYFVSIANLKVHPYTRMTGVLKNSLGLLADADISSLHAYLSAAISGLHKLVPPDLCIIDGRIGLEGRGPILGDPVRTNTLLVGRDALVVDEAACRLMEIPVRDVAHLRQTAKDLGRKLGNFEVAGELRPRAFSFDDGGAYPSIQTKFASRRLHERLAVFSNLWIDRAYRFKREPATFMNSAMQKLVRHR